MEEGERQARVESQQLLASDGARDDYFGWSVALIGAPVDYYSRGSGAGAVSGSRLRGDRGDSPLHHRPAHPCIIAVFTPASARA